QTNTPGYPGLSGSRPPRPRGTDSSRTGAIPKALPAAARNGVMTRTDEPTARGSPRGRAERGWSPSPSPSTLGLSPRPRGTDVDGSLNALFALALPTAARNGLVQHRRAVLVLRSPRGRAERTTGLSLPGRNRTVPPCAGPRRLSAS